jgi:hypothetical protein
LLILFISLNAFYESFYLFCILDAWLDFEARIDVEAEAFVVMKLPESLCIFRPDASRKQEGQGTLVVREYVPTELLAASAKVCALCIKEKQIDEAFVLTSMSEIRFRTYADSFDDFAASFLSNFLAKL